MRHEIVRRPRLAVACAVAVGLVLGVTAARLAGWPGAPASAGARAPDTRASSSSPAASPPPWT